MEYILFDLDGTLTDPKLGITKCVQYALSSMGIEEPNLDKLEVFIGPPLKDSFMKYYGMDEQKAEKAIEKYRERFQKIGIYENKLYKGIPLLLKNLKASGCRLAIASSKPTVFVEEILKYFKIRKYFEVVVGSELDGTRTRKEDVVKETLDKLFGDAPIDRTKVVMVGDRKFDIQGAKSWYIQSIGVEYGYGSKEELKEAGANHIVSNLKQLEELLLEKELRVRKEPPLRKLWLIILPFLTFLLIRQISIYLGYTLLSSFAPLGEGNSETLFWEVSTGNQIVLTNFGVHILSALSFVSAGFFTWYLNRGFMKKLCVQTRRVFPKRESLYIYILLGTTAMGISLGLNIFFHLTGITRAFSSFQEVSKSQYSVAIPLGLFIYGLAAPIAEELIFRGILYQRLRKMISPSVGMFISSLLFALYHGNMVQGLFAFCMGLVIVFLYEEFGHLYLAIAMHSLMNLTSYILTISGQYNEFLGRWYVCILALLVGIGSFTILYLKNYTFHIKFIKNEE